MMQPGLGQSRPMVIPHSSYGTAFEYRVVSPLYRFWHRSMDILFSLWGLIALCLLLPVVALCNCLESPGPIFYTQERLGYMGKPFKMYKLRSMRIDAERGGNAIWATRHDPRTTRVGRFLRATHLDELPQVINILRGDMSLIGPRPEREVYAVQLEQIAPWYRERLMVKPGLTGLAQVKHDYGGTKQDELIKLEYDLYYIKYQSWYLDMVILLRTVGEVVFRRGI
jgi:lipopolysaccharide/colanic/teichoic acid biosynthesis glycosyltransferase